MKWGIVFASTTFPRPEAAIALAEAAEAAGFESLWCPEHVVVPVGEGVTPYGGSTDGKMDRLWKRGGIPDPLVWLAFVASRTSTIKLGTNVLIVPEHQPAVLAKTVSTLDSLSNGRVLLGIGVGELPEEYAAVGMEFHNRGKRMDETIESMRALWQDEVANYDGTYVKLDNIRCDPSPANGTVPLHVGGISEAAMQRAAKYGDGYFPWVGPGLDLHATLRTTIDGVRARAAALGRDPKSIEMTVGGARTADEARVMADMGVDRCTIAVRSKDLDDMRAELAQFGREVIAPTRDM
jgi:probable F420-dependent oxidoreductase